MKTAVSLPDELFAQAEAEAKRLSISRSELYARAISEYFKRRRDEEVTEQLNRVYETESSELDPVLYEMQYRTWIKEKW